MIEASQTMPEVAHQKSGNISDTLALRLRARIEHLFDEALKD
jgi:hypothetical protein